MKNLNPQCERGIFQSRLPSRFSRSLTHLFGFEQVQLVSMIAILVLSLWAFGCVAPLFELFLAQGLVILLALWCARLVWEPGLLALSLKRAGPAGLALLCWLTCVAIPLLPVPDKLAQWLSPSVAEWMERTHPSEREVLASTGVVIPRPSSTLLAGDLTLHRAGNWQFLWRLSALALLFVACASLKRPQLALRQIAWAAAVTGSLLALVAMLQRLTPDNTQIYWFFDASSTSYGPFLNRNHYPFWANLAIGLTLGLLLDRRGRQGPGWLGLVHDTTALWLVAALALQLCSLAMGVSRGGIASLVVAVTLCTLLRRSRGGGTSSALIVALVVTSAVGLMTWAGFDLLESRLATLSEAETYREDGRWYLWRVATLVGGAFPLFGSGGETFRYWETIIQFDGPWSSEFKRASRADNEYLDVFCEYGLLAALSMLGFVGCLLLGCWKRIRSDGLIAGAIVGLLSVSLHSVVDFGLRIPASAVFATMVAGVCYAVCRRSDVDDCARQDAPSTDSASRGPTRGRVGQLLAPGLTLLAIMGVFAFLAVFVGEKSRFARADQCLVNAYRAAASRNWQQTQLELDAMIAATPDDVLAHIEHARLSLAVSLRSDATDPGRWIESAIVHCVQARDVCPLAWESQFWIAEQVEYLAGSVSRLAYLHRGHWLHPSNPTIAYLLGLELHQANASREVTYQAWSASLRKSTQYLRPILERCFAEDAAAPTGLQKAEEIRQQVLPNDPATLREAAKVADSLGQSEARQLYLQTAAAVLEHRLPQMKPEDRGAGNALAAEVHLELGQPDRTAEYLRAALRSAPQQLNWRIKLIETLIELGDFAAAEKELRLFTLLQPEAPQIAELQQKIDRGQQP